MQIQHSASTTAATENRWLFRCFLNKTRGPGVPGGETAVSSSRKEGRSERDGRNDYRLNDCTNSMSTEPSASGGPTGATPKINLMERFPGMRPVKRAPALTTV